MTVSQPISDTETITLQWRKSRRSNNGGSCVEVAPLGGTRLTRDSKDPDGPLLALRRAEWAELLDDIKAGRLDLP
ncbi:DUF397 domain-containing protein [Actinomadura cremea]|nr:DUF397 domain-containing protein [Actinomadura cremea]